MNARVSRSWPSTWRALTVLSVLGAAGCGDSTAPPEQGAKYLVSAGSSSPIAGTAVTVSAQLADANNHPLLLAGRAVTWDAVGAGGTLSAATGLTKDDGTATVTLRTSPLAGITHTVTATTGGVTGTSTGITTVVGPAARYNVSSSSTNPVAGTAIVISARLADMNGNPVETAGRVVTWNSVGSGGSFSSPTSTTDAGGSATVTFTTSGAIGTASVSAIDGSGLSGHSESIRSVAGPAAGYNVTLNVTNPIAGTAIVITAQMADLNGNPVEIAARVVTWSSSGAGGAFSSPTSTTSGGGDATVTFTTSDTPGATYTFSARDGNSLSGTSTGTTTLPQISLVSLASGLGAVHSCGIESSGAAYCWGVNADRQLGNGGTTNREFPAPVSGNLILSSVSGGARHTCGITGGGAAYCWGYNGFGQLGDNSFANRSVPALVAGGLSFALTSAGASHTCGMTMSGAAYCWGSGSHGQLGIGPAAGFRTTPVPVSGALTFNSVTAGRSHSCGVTTSGAAYCWGSNSSGELGDNSLTQRSTPVLVSGSLNFTSVSAGNHHTCGVIAGGAAYCWGENFHGQLGSGATGPAQRAPLPVKGGIAFISVAAGPAHSCGVATNGAAYCWGSNGSGELGNDSHSDSSTPVTVGGGFQFRWLGTGGIELDDYYYGSYFVDHTCGITTAGSAYCWGSNEYGQLGSGKTVFSSSLPLKVGGQP